MYQKIILISLDWTRCKDPAISLGHASLLANLITHSIVVIDKSWSVNHPTFDIEDVIRFIIFHTNADTCVAFGAFVWNEIYIQNILSVMKQRKIPGKIIVGGPQISYIKSESTDTDIEDCTNRTLLESFYPQADIFIRGYAESVLVDLMLSSDPLKTIAGVHYCNTRDDNSLSCIDLSILPSPLLLGLIQPKQFLRWETKRGCPFACAFCQHIAPETHRYYEFPLDRIKQEAKWIISHPQIKDIAIVDPTFNIGGTHYLDVMRTLIDLKYSGKISLQCRLEFVTDAFLETVTKLGETAQIILEFGLQTINEQEEVAIQRKNNHMVVSHILKQCVRRNIKIEISLIYGLPLQTVNSFVHNIQFLINLGVPIIRAWPLMLLRGTALYKIKKQYSIKESGEAIPHVISSCSFSLHEYKKMQTIANSLELYNKVPKEKLFQWLSTRQPTSLATLPSYANAISFFKKCGDLIDSDYVIEKRHSNPILQQIYDERFGVILKN